MCPGRQVATIHDDLSLKVVMERIWIARKHLEFEPAAEARDDFPVIYAALDDIYTYLPTVDTGRLTDQAR
jgi:hypothetical protein